MYVRLCSVSARRVGEIACGCCFSDHVKLPLHKGSKYLERITRYNPENKNKIKREQIRSTTQYKTKIRLNCVEMEHAIIQKSYK